MAKEHHIFGTGVLPDGTEFSFFQDKWDDETWELRAAGIYIDDPEPDYLLEYEHDQQRRRTDNWNPERRPKARRELGDKLVNLGLNVNRITNAEGKFHTRHRPRR